MADSPVERTTQDQTPTEGVLLPSYTPRFMPVLKTIAAITVFAFTFTSVLPAGYAQQPPAVVEKEHLRGEQADQTPPLKAGLEDALKTPVPGTDLSAGLTRRQFGQMTAAAFVASLIGISLTPEEAASQELPERVRTVFRQFLNARRITGTKPVMPANLIEDRMAEVRKRYRALTGEDFTGFDFNDLYTEFEPGDRDRPLTQFGRFWPYGNALILQALVEIYRSEAAAGRKEAAAETRREAMRLMNALIKLGKTEQALGFEGGYHFSYNTNGDNFIHPVAPTGNNLWVTDTLYSTIRELGGNAWDQLEWVNGLRRRVLDDLQVRDEKDLRFGLIQGGRYTTDAGRINPRTRRAYEIDDREYLDEMGYRIYRGNPNRILEDISAEHNVADAMSTLINAVAANLAAPGGTRGRLTGKDLDPVVGVFRRLAENINKLWVTDEKEGDHFITGMEKSEKGEWQRNPSKAVDNSSWAIILLAYNPEMAWKSIQYVQRHFIVRQRIGDMEGLPAATLARTRLKPGDPNRINPDERVAGNSFFHPAFIDRFIRALVPADDPGRKLWAQMLHPEATFGTIHFLRRFAETTRDEGQRKQARALAEELTRGMQRLQELYGGKLPNSTRVAPLFTTLFAITPVATALIVALGGRNFLLPEIPKILRDGITIRPRAKAGIEEGTAAAGATFWAARPSATVSKTPMTASGAEELSAKGESRRDFMKQTALGATLIAAAGAGTTGVMALIPNGESDSSSGTPLPSRVMVAQPGEGVQTETFQVGRFDVPVYTLDMSANPSRAIKAGELSASFRVSAGHAVSEPQSVTRLYASLTASREGDRTVFERETARQTATVVPRTLFFPSVNQEVESRVGRTASSIGGFFSRDQTSWTAPRTGARELAVPLWDTWMFGRMSGAQREAFFRGMRGGRVLYNMDGAIRWTGYSSYPDPTAVAREVTTHILHARHEGAKTSPLMGGKDWTLERGKADGLLHVEQVANSYRLMDWDQVWLDLEVWTTAEWTTTLDQLHELAKKLREGEGGDPARIRAEMRIREARLRTMAWQWYQFHTEVLERLPHEPSKLYTFVPTPTSANPAEDPWTFTRLLKQALDEHRVTFNRRRIELVPMGYQQPDKMGQAVTWAGAAMGVPVKAAAFNLLAMPGAPAETLYDEFQEDPQAAEDALRSAVRQSGAQTVVLHVGNVEGAMALGTDARVLSRDRLLEDPVFRQHVEALGPLGQFFVGEPLTTPIRERAVVPVPRSFRDEVQRNVSSFGQGLSTGPFGAASPYRAGVTVRRLMVGNVIFELDMIPGGTESMFLRAVRLVEGEMLATGTTRVTGVEILRGVGKNARPLTENVTGISAGLFIPSGSEPLTLRITAKRDPQMRPWQSVRLDVAARVGSGYWGSGSETQTEEWGKIYIPAFEDQATVDILIPSSGAGTALYNIKLVNEQNEVVEWIGSGQDPSILASAWPYLMQRSLTRGTGELDQWARELASDSRYRDKTEDQLMQAGRQDLVVTKRVQKLNPVGIALGGLVQGIARVLVQEGSDPRALEDKLISLRASGANILSLRIPDLEENAREILRQNDQGIPAAMLFLDARPQLIRQIQMINHLAHRHGMDVYLELGGEALQSIADSQEARERERQARLQLRPRLLNTGADIMGVILDINEKAGIGLTGFLLYNPTSQAQRRLAEKNLVERIDAPLIVAGPAADAANPWRVSTEASLYAEVLPLSGADGRPTPERQVVEKARAAADAVGMDKPPVSHRLSKALFLEERDLSRTLERLVELPMVAEGGAAREALEERARIPTTDALVKQGIPSDQVAAAKDYARTVNQEDLTAALADPAHARHIFASAVVGAWAQELGRIQDSQHQPRFVTDVELFLEAMARIRPLPVVYAGQGYAEAELAMPPEQFVGREQGIPVIVNLTHHGTTEYAPYKVTLTGYHHDTEQRIDLQVVVLLRKDETTRLAFELKGLPKGILTFRVAAISSVIESVHGWLPGSLLPLERNLSIDGGTVQITDTAADAQRLNQQNAGDMITEARQRLMARVEGVRLLESLITNHPRDNQVQVVSVAEYRQRFTNRFNLWTNLSFEEDRRPDGLVDLTPRPEPRADADARIQQAMQAAKGAQDNARQEALRRFVDNGEVEVIDPTPRIQPDWQHRLLVNGIETLIYLATGYGALYAVKWVASNMAEGVRSLGTLPGEKPEPSPGRPEARAVTAETMVVTGSGDSPRNTENDKPASMVDRFKELFKKGLVLVIPSRRYAQDGQTVRPGTPETPPAEADDRAELVTYSQEKIIGAAQVTRSKQEIGRVDARILAGTRFTDAAWLAQVRGVFDRITQLGGTVQGAGALTSLSATPTWYDVRITLPGDVSQEVWDQVRELRRLVGAAFVRKDGENLQVDKRFFKVTEDNSIQGIQHYFQRVYADSAKRLTPKRVQGLWINQDINAELYGQVNRPLRRALVAPPIHLDWRPWTVVDKAYGVEYGVGAKKKTHGNLLDEIAARRADGASWGGILRQVFWRDIKRYSIGGFLLAIPFFLLAGWFGVPVLFAGIGAVMLMMGAPLMWVVRLGLEKRSRVDMTKPAWSPMLPIVTWGMWGALGLLFLSIGPLAAAIGPMVLGVPAVTAILFHLLVGVTVLVLLEKFGTSNLPGGRLTTFLLAAGIAAALFYFGVPAAIATFAASSTLAWWLTVGAFGLRQTALVLFYITHTIQALAFFALATLSLPARLVVRDLGETKPSWWKLGAGVVAAAAVGAGLIFGLPLLIPVLAGAGWVAQVAGGIVAISAAVTVAALVSFMFEIDGMKENASKNPLTALQRRAKLIMGDVLVPMMVLWQVLGYESSMVMRALQDIIARRPNVMHPIGFGLGLTVLFLVAMVVGLPAFITTALGLVLVFFNLVMNLIYTVVDRDLGRLGVGWTIAAVIAAALAVTFLAPSLAVWIGAGALLASAVANVIYFLRDKDREPGWKHNFGWVLGSAVGAALLTPAVTAFVGMYALPLVVGIFLLFHVAPAMLIWAGTSIATFGLRGDAATEKARRFLHDTSIGWFLTKVDNFFTGFHGLTDVLFMMRDSSGDPITLSDPETQLLGTWEQRGRWYAGDIFVKMFQWAGYRIGVAMLHWRYQKLTKQEEFSDLMERLLASRERGKHSSGLWRLLEDWILEKWTGMTAGPPITGIKPIEGAEAEKFRTELDRDISPLVAGAHGRFVTHLPGVENPPALVLPFTVLAAEATGPGAEDIVNVTLKDEVSFMRFTTRNNETNLAKGQKLAMIRSWMYGEGQLRLTPVIQGSTLQLSITKENDEEYAFFAEEEMKIKHHLDTAQAALREREGVVGATHVEALTPTSYVRGRSTEDRMTPTAKFWRLPPEIVSLLVPGGEGQLKTAPESAVGGAPFGRLLKQGSANLLDTKEPSAERPKFAHDDVSPEDLEKGLDLLKQETAASAAGVEEKVAAGEAVLFAGKAAKELLAGLQGHPFARAFLHITWDPTATPQTDLIHAAPYTNAAWPHYGRVGVKHRSTRTWGFLKKDFNQQEKQITNGGVIPVLMGMTEEQMGAIIVRQFIEDKKAGRTQLTLTRYVRSLAATQPDTDTLYQMMLDPNAEMGAKWAKSLGDLHLLTGAAADQEAERWARHAHQLRVNDKKVEGTFDQLPPLAKARLKAESLAAIRDTANFSNEFRQGRLHLYSVRSFWHRLFAGLLNGLGIGVTAAFIWSGPVGIAVGIGVAVLSFLMTHWSRSERGMMIGGSAALMALGGMWKIGVLAVNLPNPVAWAAIAIGIVIAAASGILIYAANSGNGFDRNVVKVGIIYGGIAGVLLAFYFGPAFLGAALFGTVVGLWAAYSNGLVPSLWVSGGRNWVWMGVAAAAFSWVLFSTFGVPVFLPVVLTAALLPTAIVTGIVTLLFRILRDLDPPYSRDVRILARLFGRTPGQFAGYWDSSSWRLMVGLPWMEGLTYFRIPLWKRGGVIPADAPPLSMMEALLTLNIPERQAPISAFNLLRWRRAYAIMEQITKAEDTLGGYVGVADLWRGTRRGASGTGAPLPPADVMAEQLMIHLAGEMSQLDLAIPRAAEEALGEGLRIGHRMMFRSPILTEGNSAHRGNLVGPDGRERGVTVLGVKQAEAKDADGRTVIRDEFHVKLDPENEGGKPEFFQLTTNRDGTVIEVRDDAGTVIPGSPHLNGLLATPYRVLDHLWGMRPFEMLQMKFPTLAYGAPNLTNQLSGWTAYRLNMDRVGGTFGPGSMENAHETGNLLDPDISARFVEAMEWRRRNLARLLAARVADGHVDQVQAMEQQYLGMSAAQIRETLRIINEDMAGGKLKDNEKPIYLLGQQILPEMLRLREALDVWKPEVEPVLKELPEAARSLKGKADGVDLFMALADAVTTVKLSAPKAGAEEIQLGTPMPMEGSDAAQVIPLSVSAGDRRAEGRAIVVDPGRVVLRQPFNPAVISGSWNGAAIREQKDKQLQPGQPLSSLVSDLNQWGDLNLPPESKPLFLMNSLQTNFWEPQGFLVSDGKLVAVPNVQWSKGPTLFVLDAGGTGLKQVPLVGGLPDVAGIGEAVVGPVLVANGQDLSGSISQYQPGSPDPNGVRWDPKTAIAAFSAIGRTAEGRLIFLALAGNPDKGVQEVTIGEVARAMIKLGAVEAVLLGGSMDVQQWVAGDGTQPGIEAKHRNPPHDSGRPLNVALAAFLPASVPASAEEGTPITLESAAKIVRGWETLDDTQRQTVVQSLADHGYTLEKHQRHADLILKGEQGEPASFQEFPPTVDGKPGSPDRDRLLEQGSRPEVLGRIGIVIAAAGEGTRLIVNASEQDLLPPDALLRYVKPTAPIMPVTGKPTLFYQLEMLASLQQRSGVPLPVRLVLHEEAGDQVEREIRKNGDFGLKHLEIVRQGMNPGLTPDGKIALFSDGTVAFNPDGTGGVIRAALQDGGAEWFERILGSEAEIAVINGDMLLEPDLIKLVAGASMKRPVVGIGYDYPQARKPDNPDPKVNHQFSLGTFAVTEVSGRRQTGITEYRERGNISGFLEAMWQAEEAAKQKEGPWPQGNSGLYAFPLKDLLGKVAGLPPHHQKKKDAYRAWLQSDGSLGREKVDVEKVEEFAPDVPRRFPADQVVVLSVNQAILTPVKDPPAMKEVRTLAVEAERSRAGQIALTPQARVEFHPAMNWEGRVIIGQNVRIEGAVGLYIHPAGVTLYTRAQPDKPWEPFDPSSAIELFPAQPGQPVVIPDGTVFTPEGVKTAAGAEEKAPARLKAMASDEIRALIGGLREIAEGPDLDASIEARARMMDLQQQAAAAAEGSLRSPAGFYAPSEAPAPVVFLFNHSDTWRWALPVATTGAPVAVLADTISVAAGMGELFRRARIPESRYAVVSLEQFGGDKQAALKELQSRFPGAGFAEVPRGASLAGVERFLREQGVVLYGNAAAGAEEVEKYIGSLA